VFACPYALGRRSIVASLVATIPALALARSARADEEARPCTISTASSHFQLTSITPDPHSSSSSSSSSYSTTSSSSSSSSSSFSLAWHPFPQRVPHTRLFPPTQSVTAVGVNGKRGSVPEWTMDEWPGCGRRVRQVRRVRTGTPVHYEQTAMAPVPGPATRRPRTSRPR